MQIRQSGDPQLRLCNMKIKLEIPPKQVMAPSRQRSLPRRGSAIADPPSPFSSNLAHQPLSMPTTPAHTRASSSTSFGCMATPTTDSPPATPADKVKPKPVAAAFNASQWSPRRLMQRAARAFRGSSRSSRRVRAKDVGEERASSGTGKVSNEAVAVPVGGGAAELTTAASVQAEEERHDHDHPEVVPEKIIREANPHVPPPATAAEEVESLKKGAASVPEPEPEPEPEAVPAATEDVADKFVTVVKEVVKQQEATQDEEEEVAKKHEAMKDEKKDVAKKHEATRDEKEEAMRRFQGSRVKTAMEARPESEQPRRREVARSNDVIEEARSNLLEKRKLSRVRALVGAFETVMDTNKDAATPKPQHHYRKSA